MSIKPFSEASLFEQGNESDPFYATGSSPSLGDGTFTDPLTHKEQVRLSFQVKNPVRMLRNSSSIYYFSPTSNQWKIPSNATIDLAGPFDKFSYNTRWINPSGSAPPNNYTRGSFFTEDTKLFTVYGRCVASGSSSPFIQTIDGPHHINSLLDVGDTSQFGKITSVDSKNKFLDFMTADYVKGVQRSDTYRPSSDEVFTISQLDKPFLIEKIVIEVPFAFSSSWFDDRTATVVGNYKNCTYNGTLLNSNAYATAPWDGSFLDRGGPALTLAIFSLKNYGTGTVLDLIASGTITHSDDLSSKNRNDIRLSDNSGRHDNGYLTNCVQLTSLGIDTPAGIVSSELQVSEEEVECTVISKLCPSISNGVDVTLLEVLAWSTASSLDQAKDYFRTLFSTKNNRDLPADPDPDEFFRVSLCYPTSVDPFGRGMTGFNPSGGSVFGQEYLSGREIGPYDPSLPNVYYIPDNIIRQEQITKMNNLLDEVPPPVPPSARSLVLSCQNFSFGGNKASPYLVNPGENLVLSISKTRPALSGVTFNIANSTDADVGKGTSKNQFPFTGSISSSGGGSDVQLTTGSINITFYGSYVREGGAYRP